jgi:hypothetical protein
MHKWPHKFGYRRSGPNPLPVPSRGTVLFLTLLPCLFLFFSSPVNSSLSHCLSLISLISTVKKKKPYSSPFLLLCLHTLNSHKQREGERKWVLLRRPRACVACPTGPSTPPFNLLAQHPLLVLLFLSGPTPQLLEPDPHLLERDHHTARATPSHPSVAQPPRPSHPHIASPCYLGKFVQALAAIRQENMWSSPSARLINQRLLWLA